MINPYTQFRCLYSKDIFWGTLIVLFHICRKTIFNVRSSMDEATEGNSGTLLLVLCIFLNLCYVYKNYKCLKYSLNNSKSFLLFIVVCFMSVIWSPVPDIKGIIAKGLELLSSYIMLSIMLYKIGDVWRCMYYIVFIATGAAFLGGIYTGFGHTNTYSISALLGTILAFGLYRNCHVKCMKYYAALNFVMLILGTSSASYISFIFALIILLSTNKKGINLVALAILALGAFFVYRFGMSYISDYIFYGHSEEQIESGTGRDFIWDIVFKAWKERPLLGYGFVIGERWVFADLGDIFILSAHNGYFSVLLGTGLCGMAFFAYYILKTLLQGYFLSTNVKYGGLAAILIAALMGVLANNMSYPCLGADWNHPFPAIILLMMLLNTMKSKIIGEEWQVIIRKF